MTDEQRAPADERSGEAVAAAGDEIAVAPPVAAGGEPHPWSEPERPRGLDAYFAPGGEDDAPPERIADERRLTRLLVLMVALLVGVPLLLTAVAFVVELMSLRAG